MKGFARRLTHLEAFRGLGTMLAVSTVFSASPAQSFDWGGVVGHVTAVETTYMPGKVTFMIDADAGNCPAGSWLTWNAVGDTEIGRIANTQAALTSLTSALYSGNRVRIYGLNQGCTVQFLHLLK